MDKEKVEVAKDNGTFFYTGWIWYDPEEEIYRMKTVRGEYFKFRPSQINGRLVIEEDSSRDDMNELREKD